MLVRRAYFVWGLEIKFCEIRRAVRPALVADTLGPEFQHPNIASYLQTPWMPGAIVCPSIGRHSHGVGRIISTLETQHYACLWRVLACIFDSYHCPTRAQTLVQPTSRHAVGVVAVHSALRYRPQLWQGVLGFAVKSHRPEPHLRSRYPQEPHL
jgi:hypothetical protein